MLNKFELLTPTTLDEAISMVAGRDAYTYVAGGTDVFVEMHAGNEHLVLVDIKKLPELMGIEKQADGGYKLGALVTHAEILKHEGVFNMYPALIESCEKIGSVQVRNRATIGGNVCNASPAGDGIGALLVLGAVVNVRGEKGERAIPIDKFFTGVKKTALSLDEIVVSIVLPAPAKQSSSTYTKLMSRKAMEIAILGAGAYIATDADGVCIDAKFAFVSVAPTPIRLYKAEEFLIGKKLTEENIAAAKQIAYEIAKPRTWRNIEEYVKDMAPVYFEKSLQKVIDRMKGE